LLTLRTQPYLLLNLGTTVRSDTKSCLGDRGIGSHPKREMTSKSRALPTSTSGLHLHHVPVTLRARGVCMELLSGTTEIRNVTKPPLWTANTTAPAGIRVQCGIRCPADAPCMRPTVQGERDDLACAGESG
jgi:hypothetical protein